MTSRTWVVLNDLQMPFHDVPVVDLVLEFIKDLKPHGVVLNGDILDFYDLSTFDKNPLMRGTLDEERHLAQGLMGTLAKVAKERWWLDGNHEDRLRRYVWRYAPKLGVLPGISFVDLFNLDEFGFHWKPYGASVDLGRLTVTHGTSVNKHSAYTARTHLEKYGSSVLIGHTHRLGVFYKTDKRGVHGSWENGCLCRLDPEYDYFPNWQQGFSVVHVGEGGLFNVNQIPVIDRQTFFYGGARFTVPARLRRAA